MKPAATTSLSLTDLKSVVQAVCERHPVARLELFGSQAAGRIRPDSDVDLLVEFLPGSKPGLLEMGALQDELEQQLGRKVDLLSRRGWRKAAMPIAGVPSLSGRSPFMPDDRQSGHREREVRA